MCLLINQEKGSVISDENLERAYDANNDGAGFTFVKDGRIELKKYRRFNKFLRAYKSDVEKYGADSSFIVHFRIATHGLNEGTINVHPFKVNTNLAFAHNGMISKATSDDKYSDTQMFNFEYLQKMPEGFIKNKAIQGLIGEYIGSSKLVFLDNQGNTTIVNEHMGHWDSGIWYSNCSYQETYGNYGSYGSYTGGYNYPTTKTVKSGYGYDSKSYMADLWLKAKEAPLENACNWCGASCDKLTKVDVSARWKKSESNDEPTFVDMCDDCLSYELKHAVDLDDMKGDGLHV